MKTTNAKPTVQDIFPDIKIPHTQGEWEIDGYCTTAIISKQSNGSYKHIAECNYGREGNDENLELNKTNAQRIVKAVNMHDELIELADAVSKISCWDDFNDVFLIKSKQLLKQAEQK